MKIPLLARYNGAVSKAYEFVDQNISSFPINPFEIIKSFHWGLLSYEDMALKNNCNIEDIIDCLGTDGYSIYNGHNYTIAYNNKIKSQGRINFTLAHEIGHIVLNHHKDFEVTEILQDNFSKEEYKILENEANCFARNFLAPAPLVFGMKFWNKLFDMPDYFGITFSATTTRISLLNNDLYYLTENQVNNFQQNYRYFKKCPNCGANTINLSNLYCKYCGNKLINGDGFIMKKYDGIYTLSQCPNCQSVDIKSDDKFCIICGTSLENVCTTCKCVLPNNARFCYKCGQKSLYFQSGELPEFSSSTGTLLTPTEEQSHKWWIHILDNIKGLKKAMLYTNLYRSKLVMVDENTFRNSL